MTFNADAIKRRAALFRKDAGENPWFRWGLLIAAVILIADQATKYWIVYIFDLPLKGQVEILPFFDLTYVRNYGVSFGLLSDANMAGFLIFFSGIVAAALVVWLASIRRPLLAVSVSGVIGGAIGNLIDRSYYGYVVDFLDFSGLYFPYVFNIADSAISVGVALILLDSFLEPKPAEKDA